MNCVTPISSSTDCPRAPAAAIAVVTETYPPEVNGVAVTLATHASKGCSARRHDLQLVRLRQHARRHAAARRALQRGVDARLADSRVIRTAAWACHRSARCCGCGPAAARRGAHRHRRAARLVGAARRAPAAAAGDSDFRTNFHAYSQHYRLGWLRAAIVGYLRRFHNRTACTMVPTEALRAQLEARLRATWRWWRAASTRALRSGAAQRRAARAVGRRRRRRWSCSASAASPRRRTWSWCAAPSRRCAEQPPARAWCSSATGRCARAARALPRCASSPASASGDDLAAHYASADLFLFPSLTETFGNVTPEAMASGLPVVAFDCAAGGAADPPATAAALAPPADARLSSQQGAARSAIDARPARAWPRGARARRAARLAQ